MPDTPVLIRVEPGTDHVRVRVIPGQERWLRAGPGFGLLLLSTSLLLAFSGSFLFGVAAAWLLLPLVVLTSLAPLVLFGLEVLLRRHRLGTLRLESHRLVWCDVDGVERGSLSVHEVDAVGCTRDLLSPVVFVRTAHGLSALRLDEAEQAAWLVDTLQAWTQDNARRASQEDRAAQARLRGLRSTE